MLLIALLLLFEIAQSFPAVPGRLVSFMSSRHKLESLVKKDAQLRKYTCKNFLKASTVSYLMIAMGRLRSLWVVSPLGK